MLIVRSQLRPRLALLNNGQSCIAAKRFILVGNIAKKFEQGFAEKFRQQKVGDPLQPDVDIGPLSTLDILEELTAQVGSLSL